MKPKLPERRPVIQYPTIWPYKLIGPSREGLEAAAHLAAGERPHTVALSRRSASERYVSLTLEVEVEDEAVRLAVFDALQREAAVLIVL